VHCVWLGKYTDRVADEYGMFQQQVDEHGAQVEMPDDWLVSGNVWEIARPEVGCPCQW
jgi:starch phosphorylase